VVLGGSVHSQEGEVVDVLQRHVQVLAYLKGDKVFRV
jgi:hypothetical protein